MGTINTLLNSVSATLAQQTSSATVRSSALAASAQNANAASDNTAASFTSPSASVVENASLFNASASFAQLGSLLEVAQGGTQQVSDILQQLVSLAQQVPQASDLSGIESEFSQLLVQLNQAAQGTTFGGKSLLDGTYAASADSTGADGAQLSLPNLTTQGLFGSSSLSLSSPGSLANTLSTLATAQGTTSAASENIGSILGQLGFASASINTVIANNVAASSTLTESDIANGTIVGGFSSLFGSPSAAAQAQGGNLPPGILSLLQD